MTKPKSRSEEKNENLKKNIEKDKLRKLAHLKEKFGTGENSEFRQNMERRNRSRRFVKKSVWTKRQRKFRNRGVKLYFNYSKIPISPAMDRLLNRGLHCCITPSKVNVTELLIDIDKFVRKMLWREFFYDQPSDEKRKEPIVKNEKTNLPKKHKTPEKLKMFLHATTSDLLDTKTRNKVHNNLPPEELEALKQLIELQKNRVITIKPADKGAGIVILEFDDYIKSCYDHLGDTQKQPDDTLESYYEEIDDTFLEKAKDTITKLVQEGYVNSYLSKEEYEALDPNDKGVGRFYQIFKVHKPHPPGAIPPGRPIVSGNGSISENISKYVNHHIKHFVEKIPAYLEDTPHFLRVLEQENEIGPPLENVILVTIDVSSLYTNIPLFEGIEEVRNVLQDREDISVPTEFICRMLEQVLTANIFEFDQKLFLQKIGTAMGTVCAPPFANIFMNKIDILLRELARNIVKDNEDPIRLYKRFLDDIFMVWTGSVEDLQTFLKGINNLHPTIKFTAEFTSPYFCEMEGPHDCFCHQTQSVPFLDTSVSVKQGKFSTDLYKKPTDRCQYLLPSSCHPSHIVKNIPYNLAYRILRICSEKENLTKRLSELKTLLISREYRERKVWRMPFQEF